MSGSKAKEIRKEGKEIIAEFRVQLLKNNDVSVTGPIDNFLLFRYAMNRAERAVLDEISKPQSKRIVVPTIVPGNIIK